MALTDQIAENISPPLSIEQESEVRQKTLEWIAKAEELFSVEGVEIDIHFDLKGRTSGMFCTHGNRQWIRYNPWIFAKHFDYSLSTTVPHEVAHYICFLMYGKRHLSYGRQLKPHGKEWKAIMGRFGVPANATCKLDISDLPQKRLKRFAYQCSCRTHELTSIRHNRILQGKSSSACPKCSITLRPVCT